ncbi:MAG: ankyrin repeat domain-containing protein [Gemmatimonadota bacterium]|nr:ankyrin repeat domain-containing protein [Gemmatimonadota bacterium]
MLAFRKAMICIAAIALLPMAFRASIGAGSDEDRTMSHTDSVDAAAGETAAIGSGGPQPPEQSSGVQLLAAVERGDVAEVLKLVESGAYAPGSLNGLRALKTAKDREDAEIVALLEPAFDKYWEDGLSYDDWIKTTYAVSRYRYYAQKSPDNSSNLRADAERHAFTEVSHDFKLMGVRDTTGLWAPMTERFDENELRRRITKAFDAVDEELRARSEAAARDTIPFMMRFAPETHQAAARGDVKQLTDLLQDGANPNVPADSPLAPMPQSSPLHYAASTGQVPTIDVLVDAGADVNAQDRDKKTPLHVASGEGQIAAISALIEAGADPNGLPGQVTPIYSAARNGHVAAIRVLVDAGADVNLPDNGQAALRAASAEGHIGVISALLEFGVDPNATTSDGTTPLHEAAWSGHVDAVAALVEAGADTRARDKLGRTAEIMANIRGHAETKKLLQDIDPDAPRTGALHSAALGGDLKKVASLLEAGADPNARDEHQLTPLHNAMLLMRLGIGHVEVVVSLLAAGADPNAQDKNQITPLHMAVMLGTVETINTLIAAGADPNLRSAANETPLQLAERLGKSDLADALR